jgi:hypothetical protein
VTRSLAYAPGIGWRPYAGHLQLPGRGRVVLVELGDIALPVDERHSFVIPGRALWWRLVDAAGRA